MREFPGQHLLGAFGSFAGRPDLSLAVSLERAGPLSLAGPLRTGAAARTLLGWARRPGALLAALPPRAASPARVVGDGAAGGFILPCASRSRGQALFRRLV